MKNSKFGPLKTKKEHALQWVFETLVDRTDFIQKRMFGCLAGYLGDRIVLVLADKESPWNGVLVPTERSYHEAICGQFPTLVPHPVLGKWLYLDQGQEDFEKTVEGILRLIQQTDTRIGVIPKPKKRRNRKLQKV